MGKVIAIIPAAGKGIRLGKGIPKAFLEVAGVPLIVHTLLRFEKCPDVDELIVLVHQDYLERCRDLFSSFKLKKVRKVLPGGKERMDSVRVGLSALPPDTELVVIHDGARPLVSPSLISQVVGRAREVGSAIAAIPPLDTMKEVEGGYILRTVDRTRLARAQTPQAFRYQIIKEAYERADKEGISATDDASLVEVMGGRVAIVPGSYLNIKVTTPEDLKMVELLLKEGV